MRDNQDFDLNGLRAFVAVVEHHGFRGAAQTLGMPRSTVSRRVMELETALGVQLLRRTTRTMALTTAGETLHQHALTLLASLGDVVRQVRDGQAAPRGTLKVSAAPTFAEGRLGPVLEGFLREQPEVKVDLHLTDRWVDLVGEGFDLALRAGVLPDSSLKARLLGVNPVHLFASPAYLKSNGRPKVPEDIRDHTQLAFANEPKAWPFIVKGKRVNVPIKPRVVVNSFVLVQQLAEAGLGLVRVPLPLAEEAERAGRLVRVLDAYALPPVPFHAVYPPSAQLPPRVRVFLDYLEAHLPMSLRGNEEADRHP
jgi:DNA-binding transcriptional LysR family regulator